VLDLSPILVAEDNDDDFFFFRRALRAAGSENPLLRFRDGSELVRFVEKIPAAEFDAASQPWLLFVDITMPILNGFEVLEWVKGQKDRVKFNPIVLSGSRRDEDVKRAFALGAKDYLVKPISPAVFASLLFESAAGAAHA
jgi:CheY-like chemotaxis protein